MGQGIRVFTLYGHGYCHLCSEMQVALAPWQQRLGFRLEVVDIHDDVALEQRFGEHVPVLMEGEEEVCHYVLDPQALRERFSAAGD